MITHAVPDRSDSVLRLVGLGLIIGIAYYAGAAVGLALKLPHATPSVLWPPNAILTAALLLTPYRLWPIALASALPAHVLLESGAGWPTTLVLALFATNCAEALIAAAGIRWLSDAPTRFDSLWRVGVFVGVAVAAAPFITSFLDAAAVSWLRGEPYWRVFTARLLSNSLTALAVVPALVTIVTSGRSWLTSAPRSRQIEAILLGGAIALVGRFLLRAPEPDQVATALAERAPVILFLPCLLWAATRCGPGGASLALLASALLLVGAAVHSHGPFEDLSPADTTMALQLILLVVSLPLLIVAALVEERRLVNQDISDRLAFEAVVAQVSSAFVHVPSDRMRDVFSQSLRRIGEFLGLHSVALFEYSDRTQDMAPVAAWAAPGSGPAFPSLARRDLLWPIERFRRNEFVRVEDVGRSSDTTSLETERTLHGQVVPLLAEEKVLGVLAFTPAGRAGTAPPALPLRIQSIARILATVLFRKQSEDALRASEAVKSAILASLTNGVVVVDRDGRIITVNDRWRRMVGDNAPPTATEVGADYLEYCRSMSKPGEPCAADAAAGIEAVARGTSRHFRLEYGSPGPCGDRTFVVRAVPLDRPEGGAVVTHVDLSEQRRAEREAQRARAELAHISRVSTMGALTASIAHQLNQPLTGILTNAQAVSRVLAGPSPALDEVRAGVSDIIEDDRRASEVIVRMRELLRKDAGSVEEIDVNAVVGDVARLLSSDAILRGVALVLQLDTAPALVRGDRVQLQQVVLNLIVNALESFANPPAVDRRVIVRSARVARNFVGVSVIDNGAGFNGAAEHAFEAFYTTKQNGMGLGLSIARSIVAAHAGVISASNNPEGGATVSFRLPLANGTA